MEKQTRKGRPAEQGLNEFDFDDILTDDFPARDSKKAPSEPGAAFDDPSPDKASAPKGKKKRTRLEKKRMARKVFGISVGMLTWIKDLAIALLIFWVIHHFIASFIVVPNDFMSPLMKRGEHVAISKIGYYFTSPGRGEIVAYRNTENSTETLLGRIIGLPGDTVVILSDGSLSVNGVLYKMSTEDGKTEFVFSQTRYPLEVPEGEYFILCENPKGVTDSRYSTVGTVKREFITGKVLFCYWPKDSWRPIAQGLPTSP